MKNLKFLSLVPALGLFTIPLEAAVYAADFEGLAVGDLNGQGGWTTTESNAEAIYVSDVPLSLPGDPPSPLGTRVASIGYVPAVSSSEVYAKTTLGGLTTLANAQFSVLFQLDDSDNGQNARDTFGFRLTGSGGANLFSFFLNPVAQSDDPSGTVGQWSFGYTTGSGAQVPFYSNPEQTLVYGTNEGVNNEMTISFVELGLSPGDVQMNVNVGGTTVGSGVLSGLASSSINELGVFWRPFPGPSVPGPGSNQLLFDNIVVVPEPGVAGLAGLAGLLCLMVRRRA